MEPILEIRNLSLALPVKKGMVSILHDVSLSIAPGEILGLVGESGSGKSLTAFSVTRLLPGGGREKLGGSIRFCGEELTEKPERDMQAIRGRDISMIFQEPMTCLNPVFTIGRQMTDVIMTHQKVSRQEAMKTAEDMLTAVRIRNAADVLRCYPYELSGGMRQRVMIGIALSCRPKLLIADEPTTALDVTVQAKILALIREACEKLGTAVLFISHDLGVISQICDTVAVMYSGHIVEAGKAADVFETPEHPYTRALMAAVPKFTASAAAGDRLFAIPGVVPDPSEQMAGCRFAPRCPFATEFCRTAPPSDTLTGAGHLVYCHNWQSAAPTFAVIRGKEEEA